MGGVSSDNTAFGVNVKFDKHSENEDFILQASMHANQNYNSIDVEFIVNLPTIAQKYLLLLLIFLLLLDRPLLPYSMLIIGWCNSIPDQRL